MYSRTEAAGKPFCLFPLDLPGEEVLPFCQVLTAPHRRHELAVPWEAWPGTVPRGTKVLLFFIRSK